MPKNQVFSPPKISQVTQGLICLIFALISVSSASILIRLSQQEISFTATIFYRLFLTALVLGIWKTIKAQKPLLSQLSNLSRENLKVIGLLTAAAICVTTDLTICSWCLTQTSVANVTILGNMSPLFTTFGLWLLWRKPCDRRMLIGIIIAIGGAAAIVLDDFSLASHKLSGDLASLGSAIAFAVYLIIIERLQNQFNTSSIVLYTCGLGSIFLLPIALLNQETIIPDSWHGWLSVIALALICQIIGQSLLVSSLNSLSSELVAVSLLLEPILAGLGAWIFFAESLSLSNWAGCVIVLLGLYLAISSPSALKKELSFEVD
ncbi:DMT family transporter [Gloeothece verrucosa]|uniref:EamA domain-containing protein n=1 Tax=Gloeothece verrucosa (strain PCC 7822) TaxID=497965 RepID=E0U6G7_GLOV7|nr:DMT family transporter [Gloeothece verrucosa]ADN13610.1 protein of unknown function DUF6 transmembrane [Gloeothece verrucosa PCC 7822]